MLLPIPEEVLQAQARDRALDTLLGSLGVSAALVSASFAAYMAAVGPPSRPMPSTAPFLSMAGPPMHAPRTIADQPSSERNGAASGTGGIDFDPTGSISPAPEQGVAEAPGNEQTVLPDFAVRDAFDGTALVEARGILHMVQPGATIDGAGKVLSVTRRGNAWVVATTGGLIMQRR